MDEGSFLLPNNDKDARRLFRTTYASLSSRSGHELTQLRIKILSTRSGILASQLEVILNCLKLLLIFFSPGECGQHSGHQLWPHPYPDLPEVANSDHQARPSRDPPRLGPRLHKRGPLRRQPLPVPVQEDEHHGHDGRPWRAPGPLPRPPHARHRPLLHLQAELVFRCSPCALSR